MTDKITVDTLNGSVDFDVISKDDEEQLEASEGSQLSKDLKTFLNGHEISDYAFYKLHVRLIARGLTKKTVKNYLGLSHEVEVDRALNISDMKKELLEAFEQGQFSFDTAKRIINTPAAIDTNYVQKEIIKYLELLKKEEKRVYISRTVVEKIKKTKVSESSKEVFSRFQAPPEEQEISTAYNDGVAAFKSGAQLSPETLSELSSKSDMIKFIDGYANALKASL